MNYVAFLIKNNIWKIISQIFAESNQLQIIIDTMS